ncbi:hypothetical protein GSY74_06400 [Sulfurovum sp. bin170]|uniref:hypothetical protein n=1 Tax=Sulfurovum sp. bin170 TaxID=2695268 RepID=UPI0013E02664|nr:hypothetical protein [Sulfurovum sp. bin170]NEW60910.1 hypothetical protein [Sulfurovum sp. bin170]
MSEKEEVLRQISEIKNHLVDKQHFFPYNYNACYIWSIIGLILTLTMPLTYGYGVLVGTVAVFLLMSFGFIAEGMMTKKVNESYDIDDCTSKQEFISKSFMMISFFLIAISAVLVTYQLYIPLYLSWLALISFGYFLVGFVVNVKNFKIMAQFNIYLSVLLLIIAIFTDNLEGNESVLFRVVQVALLLGLTIFPAIIAWQQKKEEACSV